ncbi:hypothetical protein HU200_028003 [Digitaria exilis]|uniref:SCP domain-containing protein n=1 Tax=Digitaria exilis TaxID=1010633 RepID=A0A835BSQ2_9POAL|nr:hypothetical protein HU200_028003 [Digitaria exilis]
MELYSSAKALCLALAMAMAVATVLVTPCTAQNSPQDFVDLHNAARAEVGVGEVTWDDTVAAFAQSWAEHLAGDGGCGLQHSSGSGYGENLYGGPGGDWTAEGAVGLWVAEKQWYDHDSNTCSAPEGDTCLHYTQVVWRDSTTIGCGRAECGGDAGGVIISCNYNPPGNFEGQSPY